MNDFVWTITPYNEYLTKKRAKKHKIRSKKSVASF